jgi:PhoH-like ATPase
MKKTFVLDTNVLLHDPQALFQFQDNDVVVPIYVIEEIDQFKKDLSELGRNARQISRHLDGFRRQGTLREGVPLPEAGQIRVAFTDKKLPPEFANSSTMDDAILAVALDIQSRNPAVPTVFVTKDVNLRIRADALGLRAEDYESDHVAIDELYAGWATVEVPAGGVNDFYQDGRYVLAPDPEANAPNEYVALADQARPNHTALGRWDTALGEINPLIPLTSDGVWGIRPRNREQHFALDALLRDSCKLVTLVGKSGTGKTLLALAAALHKTAEEKVFHKILVSRPIFPLGRDLGYLPGTVEDKLNPWMQPIFDNLDLLLGLTPGDKREGRSHHELIEMGLIEVEPLTYIRGRSIPNQFMIVDEAQNLTPHEVKTILTRVGDDTKIVFTGDPYQVDNPYVDSSSNGLTYLVNKFRWEPIAAHVTLAKGERSELAELAANLL